MSIERINRRQRFRKFITYDMEWIPGSLEVRMIGVYDGNKYRFYKSVRDFLDCELCFSNRGKWFYAHAGGLADIQFVLHEIKMMNNERPGYWQVDGKFSGSSAIIVKIRRGKQTWTFVDSYWLLRDRLKNIGKWIGYHKGDTGEEKDDPDEEGISDEEYERRMQLRREWFSITPLNTLREYNEKDCVILWLAINEFENTLLRMGGQLQMTLASSALELFKRKYLTRDIMTFDEVNEKGRKAYFASRVEVIESEVEDAWYYDVNSSFPFAMTKPCPGEFIGRTRNLSTNPDDIFIADCEVEVRDSFLPPTPIRMKGRVFFPSGRWRSWLSSVDLRLLEMEGGRIIKVYEVLKFAPFDDLSSYAKDLYERRKNSESPFEKVAFKLLLNSLYGKFAESSTKTGILINPSSVPITSEEEEHMKMRQLFPGAWLYEKDVRVPHMSVPISTHITAIARKTLYDFMSMCRDQHYCDTDGFSTSEELTTGDELGELKLEKKIIKGHFAASKLYKIEGKELKNGEWKDKTLVKGKGFSRLTVSRFSKLLEGEAIEFERMSRIREVWKNGGSKPREGTYKKRIKNKSIFEPSFDTTKNVIPKRFTYPDGRTRPWTFDELADMLGDDDE